MKAEQPEISRLNKRLYAADLAKLGFDEEIIEGMMANGILPRPYNINSNNWYINLSDFAIVNSRIYKASLGVYKLVEDAEKAVKEIAENEPLMEELRKLNPQLAKPVE